MGLFKKKTKQAPPPARASLTVEHVNIPCIHKRLSFSYGRKITDGNYGNFEASYWEDDIVMADKDGKIDPGEVKETREKLVKRVLFQVYKRLHEQGAAINRDELERAGILPRATVQRVEGGEQS